MTFGAIAPTSSTHNRKSQQSSPELRASGSLASKLFGPTGLTTAVANIGPKPHKANQDRRHLQPSDALGNMCEMAAMTAPDRIGQRSRKSNTVRSIRPGPALRRNHSDQVASITLGGNHALDC